MDYIGRIEDDECITSEAEIVICGCGKSGKYVYQVLKEKCKKSQVICFCDSNEELYGTLYENVPIKRYTDGITCKNAVFLIANMDVRKMMVFLKNNGIEKIHVVY